MRRIEIGGDKYVLHEQTLRHYDGFVYEDTIHKAKPENTHIIGYIIDGGSKYAVCTKSYDKLGKVIIVGLSILAIGVIGGGGYIISKALDVEVSHFTFGSRDNVVEKLDDGVVKAKAGLSYSQYATYDGSTVGVYIDTKDRSSEVKLVIGDASSEYVPVEEAYAIPISINMKEQEALEGTLFYKKKDHVEEYPITVEYLNVTKPEISQGDFTEGMNIQPTQATTEYDPANDITIENDINNYKETDIDFDNFNLSSTDAAGNKIYGKGKYAHDEPQ